MELEKQVYIVDDDESVCRSLKLLLISFGFSVDSFSSVEHFFSAVPNSVSGCLVLDIHFQGISGWEAQKKLQEIGKKTGDAWESLSEGTNKAWNDLREAVHQAGEKFK